MTKAYAISERFVPNDQRVTGFLNLATLEKGLISGAISIAIGALFLGKAVLLWYGAAFGPMDYGSTMRMVIPGATLVMLGTQTIFYSFLTSMIGINRK
jgi:hypothetical protein